MRFSKLRCPAYCSFTAMTSRQLRFVLVKRTFRFGLVAWAYAAAQGRLQLLTGLAGPIAYTLWRSAFLPLRTSALHTCKQTHRQVVAFWLRVRQVSTWMRQGLRIDLLGSRSLMDYGLNSLT